MPHFALLNSYSSLLPHFPTADEEISDKASTCGKLLIFLSVALVIMTLPFSLFVCFKVSRYHLYKLPSTMRLSSQVLFSAVALIFIVGRVPVEKCIHHLVSNEKICSEIYILHSRSILLSYTLI